MYTCDKARQGFTLLELLTVISIMIILASIVMPTLSRARLRAYKSKAKAQIAGLELALSMYEADVGSYASTSGSYQDFMASWLTGASTVPGWDGPYIELKNNELDTSGTIIDPWGQPFKYASPGIQRPHSFDLYSVGPDGIDHIVDSSSTDDIANWEG